MINFLKKIILILFIILLSFIIFFIGYTVIIETINKPGKINISVKVPNKVKLNSEFDMFITVANQGNKKETIRDIDIPSEHFENIEFVDSNPDYQEVFLGQATKDYNFRFLVDVPQNEHKEIKIKFKAIKPGKVKGEFDVCINTAGNCFSRLLNIDIVE